MFLLQIDPDDRWIPLYEIGWGVEPFLLFLCFIASLIGVYRYFPFATHRLFVASPNPGLGIMRAAMVFAALWFLLVMNVSAASDIVGVFYNALYGLLSLTVLFIGAFGRPILDLYYLGDVVERGNLAAALTYAGFMLGTAFAFGGALTGEGPGWWVVVVFFLLAYFELRANLALVSRLSGRLKDDVRLERDASAGLLLGAVACASGLVSGAAAAGDFLGWEHAIPDYGRRLWPLLLIAFLAAGIGLFTRYRENKLLLRGIGGALLVAGAFAYYVITVTALVP